MGYELKDYKKNLINKLIIVEKKLFEELLKIDNKIDFINKLWAYSSVG